MSKRIQNEVKTLGKAVGFEWVDVNKLQSFSSYQREIKSDKVIYILANFDEKKVNPICVSYRNGKYYVVDGQHTLASLKARGVEKALCHIRYGLTEQEESEWFVELELGYGKQKKSTMLNAKLLSGKYDEIEAINDIVKSVGYALDIPSTKGGGIPTIKATKAMEVLYNEFGEEVLSSAMKLHSEVFDWDKKSLQENFLKGFVKFYHTYSEDLDVKRLKFAFKKTSTSMFAREAGSHKEDKNVSIRWAKEFVRIYNYDMRKGSLLKISKVEDMVN